MRWDGARAARAVGISSRCSTPPSGPKPGSRPQRCSQLSAVPNQPPAHPAPSPPQTSGTCCRAWRGTAGAQRPPASRLGSSPPQTPAAPPWARRPAPTPAAGHLCQPTHRARLWAAKQRNARLGVGRRGRHKQQPEQHLTAAGSACGQAEANKKKNTHCRSRRRWRSRAAPGPLRSGRPQRRPPRAPAPAAGQNKKGQGQRGWSVGAAAQRGPAPRLPPDAKPGAQPPPTSSNQLCTPLNAPVSNSKRRPAQAQPASAAPAAPAVRCTSGAGGRSWRSARTAPPPAAPAATPARQTPARPAAQRWGGRQVAAAIRP